LPSYASSGHHSLRVHYLCGGRLPPCVSSGLHRSPILVSSPQVVIYVNKRLSLICMFFFSSHVLVDNNLLCLVPSCWVLFFRCCAGCTVSSSHPGLSVCVPATPSPRSTVLPSLPTTSSLLPVPRFSVELSFCHLLSNARLLCLKSDDAPGLREPTTGLLFLHLIGDVADEITPISTSDCEHLPKMVRNEFGRSLFMLWMDCVVVSSCVTCCVCYLA
jgi:hypothetical protein